MRKPRNVGTGPGVLLPLLHVLARDRQADVALVPSDHDFRVPAKMRRALFIARRAARTGVDRVLIGARAECAASDLGWIVPRSARLRRCVASIDTFVEKPGPDIAARLFESGALWNTMLCVARGQALWQLGRQHLPALVALLEEYARSLGSGRASECLRQVYERLTPADFSRDLVAASRRLRVAAMDGAGWRDCGTPERFVAALGEKVGTLPAPRASIDAVA